MGHAAKEYSPQRRRDAEKNKRQSQNRRALRGLRTRRVGLSQMGPSGETANFLREIALGVRKIDWVAVRRRLGIDVAHSWLADGSD